MRRFVKTTWQTAGLAIVLALGPSPLVWAHPNHAPLPTTGVTVQGDQILLSETSFKRLGIEEAAVADETLRKTLRLNATVGVPYDRQAMATTLVAGKLVEVLVRPGEEVAAGQVLARVESLELTRLQLELLRAVGQRDYAQRVRDRKQESSDSGLVPEKQLIAAQAELDEAQVVVDLTRRKLMVLGLKPEEIDTVLQSGEPVRQLAVTSPLAGVVLDADVRVGQVVHPEDHLYHVVDLSEVNLVGQVLESDSELVEVGQAVTFRLPTSGQVSEGVVDHVGPRIHTEDRTRHVIVHAANPDAALRPGMIGRMEVVVDKRQAFTVPVEALLGDPETGPWVLYRRGERQYLRRSVSLGLRQAGRVEVTKGLFVGDQVITTGARVVGSLFGETGAPSTPTPGAIAKPDEYTGRTLRVPGELEVPTGRQVFAAPQITGRLRAITIEPGIEVSQGQTLAELVSPELQILQLDLLLARLRHRTVVARVERLEALKAVSARQELWQAEADRDRLALEADDLARRLRLVGLTAEQVEALTPNEGSQSAELPLVEGVPLAAPIDGVAAHLSVMPGQVVSPEDRPFEILDRSVLWVRGHVWERDANLVRVGESVRVTLPALEGEVFTGRVVRVAPAMTDGQRVLPVWVELDNSEGRLLPGMLATLEVELPTDSPSREPEPRLTATE